MVKTTMMMVIMKRRMIIASKWIDGESTHAVEAKDERVGDIVERQDIAHATNEYNQPT